MPGKSKVQESMEKVRLKQWTIWKAAQYSGESYRFFLDQLRSEKITFPLSIEELEIELNETFQ